MPDKSYRLICWNRPGNLKTKPDIMLYTGEDNIWLSKGGSEYKFKEGDKTYFVNDRYLCGESTKCGLFYSVETKGMEDFKVECSRIK